MSDLVADALARARRSEPAVGVSALAHIARVLTKSDQAEAERVLDEALAVADTLPGNERHVLLDEATILAAAISPQRAFALARSRAGLYDVGATEAMLFRMLDHGHLADAVAYLSDPAPRVPYPFNAARQAMGKCGADEVSRLRVFRGAVRAMRDAQSGPAALRNPLRNHGFVQLFTRNWHRLPAEDAREVVRDLVEQLLREPDGRTNSSFGAGPHEVHFTSTHESHLFSILGPLQQLDPALASSVVGRYPDLAKAAARFPHGYESMTAEMSTAVPPPEAIPQGAPPRREVMCVGSRIIPIDEAVENGYAEAFDIALRAYEIDADPERPNDAPRTAWPSAAEFRTLFHAAGRHEGAPAARHLDRVPDPALRLFAQIELAAGVAGLPVLGSRSIRPGRGGFEQMMRARAENAAAAPSGAPRFRPLGPPRKPKLLPSPELHATASTTPSGEAPEGGSGPGFVEIRNATLRGVVSRVFATPATRIEWPATLTPDTKYDFVLVLPHDEPPAATLDAFRRGLAKHFGVRISTATKTAEAYVLTAPHGIKARAAHGGGMFEFGAMSMGIGARSGGGFVVGSANPGPPGIPEGARLREILEPLMSPREKARTPEGLKEMLRQAKRHLSEFAAGGWLAGLDSEMTMGELCETLEAALGRPMIDETGLDGAYSIHVDTQAVTSADFLGTLCDRLGLVATLTRRDIPMLVVRLP